VYRSSAVLTAAVVSSVILLAACSSGGSQGLASAVPGAASMIQTQPRVSILPLGVVSRYARVARPELLPGSISPATTVGKDLFVSNSTTSGGTEIEVLKHRTYKNIGAITEGIDGADGIWVDKVGDLYVANSLAPNVTEYAPGSNSPICTYSSELVGPSNGTTDSAGNVYVVDFNHFKSPGYIDKYARCSNVVARQYSIPLGPEGVAVDKHGNIFVSFVSSSGNGSFEEFKKGSKKPTALQVTTGPPGGLVIDGKGNLISDDQRGSIDVIAPPYTSATTLVSGLYNPFHLALNKKQTLLFNVDTGAETVTIYKYPSGTLVTTLGTANGITNPAGVADSPNAVF
jgi:hypothetical protein